MTDCNYINELDLDKNGIDKIGKSKSQKLWFKCKKGHSYLSSFYLRERGTGCPYCANQKLLVGYNDLATTRPDLLKEWDYEKNDVTPQEVMKGTSKKVWWKCKEGHSYEAKLNNKSSSGTSCPYCSNYKVLAGYNDLTTTNPELIKYWDYNKNGSLKPDMVMKGQHTKVWWIGDCGHSWEATIYHRVANKGCPKCNTENKSSFPEQAIYFYLKKIYNDIEIGNRKILSGKELDIYIPSKKIAVEFDGEAWHKDSKKDEIKDNLCIEKGITLYRIRNINCPKLKPKTNVFIIECKDYEDKSITKSLSKLFDYLNLNIDVDIERDRSKIYAQYIFKIKDNSIENEFPKLIEEWDYEKNDILPSSVSSSSNKKVWWKGKCGHSWQSVVASRTKDNAGCPYCSNLKVLKGYNDLTTTRPDLLKEWDYEKNDIKPEEVMKGSGKMIWWICSKGHSYQSLLPNKIKGIGCPYCSNHKCLSGYNDLVTTNPDIIAYWDFERNELDPSTISKSSTKIVFWKCDKGHSWEKSVYNQVKSKNKCPYCK